MCSDGSGHNIEDPGSPPQECNNTKFTVVRNNSMLNKFHGWHCTMKIFLKKILIIQINL